MELQNYIGLCMLSHFDF